MKDLSELLSKFKLIPNPKKEKELVLEVISEFTGVLLNTDDVEIQNSVIRLTCHPLIKSKIYLHKQEIMSKINVVLEKYNKTCTNII